eukprot:m.76975 g.76975  ORF g.76975 m.76975 type:complete len:337 (-) comp12594_c0_seq1:24-1034(-)
MYWKVILGAIVFNSIAFQDTESKEHQGSCRHFSDALDIEGKKLVQNLLSSKAKFKTRLLLFVGMPRTGHSLIGALLDGHKNVIVSNELDLLHWGSYKASKVFSGIISNSVYCAKVAHREQAGYNFDMPGSWQGSWEGDNVSYIGDKKGGGTVGVFLGNFERGWEKLQSLKTAVGLNVTLIHVERNAFDTIGRQYIRRLWEMKRPQLPYNSTLAKNQASTKTKVQRRILWSIASHYEEMLNMIHKIRRKAVADGMQWVEISSEQFSKNPLGSVQDLCYELKIECTTSFVKQVEALVAPMSSPSQILKWPPKLVEELRRTDRRLSSFSVPLIETNTSL